jgi:hypothetical protein
MQSQGNSNAIKKLLKQRQGAEAIMALMRSTTELHSDVA